MLVATLVTLALLHGPADTTVAPVRGPHDKAEVEAFLDGVMAAYLRDKHIAGITVSVVRDGSLLLA